MNNYIRFFQEMIKINFLEVGGKAANLGKPTRYGLNVPEGFCVTIDAFFYLVTQNQIQDRINAIVLSFDYQNLGDLGDKCAQIRELIIQAEIPEDLSEETSKAIDRLNGPKTSFVAVRSSVAVKGTDISSFPGMMDTYHYLEGEEVIKDHIKQCWASLWTRRAVIARHRKNINQHDGLIAPIVQKMVHSDIAGVMFTANPITNNLSEIVIESNWGLGELVVSGKSMNDFYLLDKSPLQLKDKRISRKNIIVCFDNEKGYGRKEVEVPSDQALTLLGSEPFDIAVLDIMGVDGFQLLDIANEKKVLAVMLTGHALSPEITSKAYKRGAAYFIPKDKMADISIFLNDILASAEKGENLWKTWIDRLGAYYNERFGEKWQDDEREFWHAIANRNWKLAATLREENDE